MEQPELNHIENNDKEYIFNDYPFEQLNEIIDDLKTINDKITENLKSYCLTKKGDLELLNNLLKNYDKNSSMLKTLNRQCLISTYSESKRNHLLYKKNKKKLKNKSNLAVNKLRDAHQFVLDFISDDLKINGQTSTAYILKYICNFAKNEIKNQNPDIFVYNEDGSINKRYFKVIGKLHELFIHVKEEALKRNSIIEIPDQLAYTQIMSYIKYCFP